MSERMVLVDPDERVIDVDDLKRLVGMIGWDEPYPYGNFEAWQEDRRCVERTVALIAGDDAP